MIRRSLAGLLLLLSSHVAFAQTIRQASGPAPADILAARDAFRTDLGGGAAAGANGSFGGVRREINWDGVPDGFAAPNNLPANFFNTTSPRGVIFVTPGTGFQVSATAASGTPVRFGNIDPSYTATFQAFTPERLFTPLGSNITDITFFVPGTNIPATVTGFGAVFTDVDATATIQYFDIHNVSLGAFPVPPSPSGGLSFLGISGFPGGPVSRVRITTGTAAPAPGLVDGAADVVVMDDFIYSEPLVGSAINVVKLTNGTNNDVPPGPTVAVGSTVTFTYTVTNPGIDTLSAVTVRDDNGTPGNLGDDFNATFVGGDTNANGLLDTNETWIFTASRIATAGQYTNIATVTGTPTAGPAVTDTDADNHFGASAAINLVKLTNGTNNDVPPGPSVAVGSTVTFTYNVTNPGFGALGGVTVRDDNGTPGNLGDDFNATFTGGDTNANGLLDSGETWTFTASRIATAGQYTNVATASGTPPVGPVVTDADSDNHFGVAAAINLVKLTNGTNNDVAPGPSVTVGTTVTFTYNVTNPGSGALSAVTVRDDNGTAGNLADDFNATFTGGDTNANGLLESGETWTFTASRIATAGQYTNTATATGTPAVGPAVTDTDSDSHFGQAAALVPTLDESMLLVLAALIVAIGAMRIRA